MGSPRGTKFLVTLFGDDLDKPDVVFENYLDMAAFVEEINTFMSARV